jgi:hypothetical protein
VAAVSRPATYLRVGCTISIGISSLRPRRD